MRSALLTLALLSLAGCAGSMQSNAAKPQWAPALPGPVTYDVSSWGRLLFHWRINPDGTGEIWRGSGLGKGPGEVRKYRLRMDEAALSAFIATIEPLRALTKGGTPCTRTISDMPYGAVTWDYPGASQKWSFDTGCRSSQADAAYDAIGEAHQIVEGMAQVDGEPYIVDEGR